MQRFVDQYGEDLVLKSKDKRGGEFRFDSTPAGKDLFCGWLDKQATATDMHRWRSVTQHLLNKLPG